MKNHSSHQAISQRKEAPVAQRASAGRNGASIVPPNHTGLPNALKSGIESLSGMSLDDVRVHYNSSKPAQLEALAYAKGTDIHIAPGQERHLPHEAWHVVQQKQGRVKPTMQMKAGAQINDDWGLEHEADAMGKKALQMRFTKSVEQPTAVGDSAQKSNYQGIIQNQRSASSISQNSTTIQLFRTWGINESARRHYDDEWGEAYGITSDTELKDAIEAEDDGGDDTRIELDVHNPSGARNGARDCYIRYENSDSFNRRAECHTYVWHCGPAV